MATKITLPQSIVLRTPIREKRSDENSTAWVKTGTRVSHLQVEIDPELLVRMIGVRAVNSKKGISKLHARRHRCARDQLGRGSPNADNEGRLK